MVDLQAQPQIPYEPYDSESRLQQFELYGRLRDEAPVYVTESGWWTISRYSDVREILLNPRLYSSSIIQFEAFGLPTEVDPNMNPAAMQMLLAVVAGMPVPPEELLAGRVIVGADPPEHTRVRRIVNRGFTARRMEQLRPKVESIVAELIEDIDDWDEFDLITDFARQLPVRVIADFLSVDPADYDRVVGWAEVSMECSSGELRGTSEAQLRIMSMLQEFGQYFVPRIDARRTEPLDDMISDLVRATESETLTTTEAMLFLLAIVVGGTESTTGLIGNLVWSYCATPTSSTWSGRNRNCAATPSRRPFVIGRRSSSSGARRPPTANSPGC